VIASELDLFNDFTFFLADPLHGDQFHQHDARLVAGGKVSESLFGKLAGLDTENTFGLQVRNDDIDLGLYQTEHRRYLSTDRVDQVDEASVGAFYENRIAWLPKVRTVFGVREDMIHATDHADDMTDFADGLYATPFHSDDLTEVKPSPKGNLILGPWAETEFFASAGMGFHSNDVRTAAYPVETEFLSSGPVSTPTSVKYPLMERATGYEVGARTTIVPALQSSLALFQLDLASEQVFDGDAAQDAPSGPSTRRGIEFSNFYSPVHGIVFDADLAVSRARFNNPVYDGTESVAAGNPINCCTGRYIAGSPGIVIGGGLEIDDVGNWFGGLQYRFYGPRPLTNDDSVRSPRTSLINIRLGYKLTAWLSTRLDIDNLLDSKMQDIAYYYVSRLPGEPAGGVADIHFHAAEPLGGRLSLVARW
jgi:outer membrane receptor protein involved in Fe transport